MTLRRVVALAQALAMILLLVPGPSDAPAFGATGTGIGCQAGTQRYRGPQEPGDPPWPPGDEPTPSPAPLVDPSGAPASPASPSPSLETSEEFADGGATALLSGSTVRVAQAEPSPEPSPEAGTEPSPGSAAEPSPDDADLAPDDADLAPDVSLGQEAAETAEDLRLISGIDVSHHNGDIDYEKVRAAGNEFVFAKATQDNDFIDPMFVTNMARARAAGLAAGGYHFFDYTLDGRDQADHFIDRLELAGALEGALPPVVDVECWAPIGSSIHAVSAARLRDFVARVYERTGRLPIIYTSVFMWKQVVGNADGFGDLPLWAACWGCEAPPSIAPGWDDWHFWQTGVGRIPGVGRLDANFFSGDADELSALRQRPFSIAEGAPATARHQVTLDLGGRDATHLRTSADGESWTGWTAVRGQPRAAIGSEESDHTLYVQLRVGDGLTSPVLSDSIALDRTGPELTRPTIELRLAALGGEMTLGGGAGSEPADSAAGDSLSVPVETSWEAFDPSAGLSDATVAVDCGRAGRSRTAVPGAATPGTAMPWTAAVSVLSDAPCEVSVVGRDGVRNETTVAAGPIEAAIVPVADGAAAGAEVMGDQVGVIARRGPDLGRAAVYLDGQAVGLLDLYHSTPTGPEIVYVTDLPADGPSTVSIEATGTADPDAAGTDVVIDALVTLSAA
jgi:GH25 family lysozyme M1 (1,4-beta-N-acetylmuramidase)